jgi:hypothetical protein
MTNKATLAAKITLTITEDVRRQLETWAQQNMTSLSAEMLRAVRFRARAERASVAVD